MHRKRSKGPEAAPEWEQILLPLDLPDTAPESESCAHPAHLSPSLTDKAQPQKGFLVT